MSNELFLLTLCESGMLGIVEIKKTTNGNSQYQVSNSNHGFIIEFNQIGGYVSMDVLF